MTNDKTLTLAHDIALKAAGELAQVARIICGGIEFTTGQKLGPSDLLSISERIKELRKAVDKYDDAIFSLYEIEQGPRKNRMVDMG